jgi:hypothetical protein
MSISLLRAEKSFYTDRQTDRIASKKGFESELDFSIYILLHLSLFSLSLSLSPSLSLSFFLSVYLSTLRDTTEQQQTCENITLGYKYVSVTNALA